MAPSAVNGANQEMVWQRMYDHDGGGTPKYRVGDHVRISKAKRGSSSTLAAILRRFGAGPGCGGAPHWTFFLCSSKFRFHPNDLRHTSQTNGVGLQPLSCRCKLARRVKVRPHFVHLCIVSG